MAALRNFKNLEQQLYKDENLITATSEEQVEVEKSIQSVYQNFNVRLKIDPNLPYLNRQVHTDFIRRSLAYLPEAYACLDASRTWLCYWSLHSLSLLQVETSDTELDKIATFLGKCQHPDGGFGGGPGQFAHLATTYAAVNALCIIGSKRAYDIINRKTLRQFLWSLRSHDGAFCMHKDGEVDIRGVYCALSIATLTNIACDNLFKGTPEWVVSCQTYEGGFSGCPGNEAHGGYTFCGLAALYMLKKAHLCDNQGLLRWIVNRQMRYEGGFQGRTNKLVDGCYSFWQGGAFTLLHELLMRECPELNNFIFNQEALQEYILICCQFKNGGLLDKPGKRSDLYHTCYALSGLSISQKNLDGTNCILGQDTNKVGKTHYVYNINPIQAMKAKSYFSQCSDPEPINCAKAMGNIDL